MLFFFIGSKGIYLEILFSGFMLIAIIFLLFLTLKRLNCNRKSNLIKHYSDMEDGESKGNGVLLEIVIEFILAVLLLCLAVINLCS